MNELQNQIDNIKDKLTDQEYSELLDSIKEVRILLPFKKYRYKALIPVFSDNVERKLEEGLLGGESDRVIGLKFQEVEFTICKDLELGLLNIEDGKIKSDDGDIFEFEQSKFTYQTESDRENDVYSRVERIIITKKVLLE